MIKNFVAGFAFGYIVVKLAEWVDFRYALAGLDRRYEEMCREASS